MYIDFGLHNNTHTHTHTHPRPEKSVGIITQTIKETRTDEVSETDGVFWGAGALFWGASDRCE
jgi:hypothetical protein